MTKLSDAQLVVLSAACGRDDLSIYPLTLKAKGGAAQKVLKSLLGKGLIDEVAASLDGEVWRKDEDGGRLTLRATEAALAVLGIETEATEPAGDATTSPKSAKKKPVPAKAKKGAKAARKKGEPKAPRATRADSKQARLVEMLKRKKGASIEEIVEAFGWQAHSVRGVIAGALKKKLGLKVESEKVDGRRVYRIVE